MSNNVTFDLVMNSGKLLAQIHCLWEILLVKRIVCIVFMNILYFKFESLLIYWHIVQSYVLACHFLFSLLLPLFFFCISFPLMSLFSFYSPYLISLFLFSFFFLVSIPSLSIAPFVLMFFLFLAPLMLYSSLIDVPLIVL